VNSHEPDEKVKEYLDKLMRDSEKVGYHVNPDMDTTLPLVEGLLTNIERYGYPLQALRRKQGGGHRHNLPLRLQGRGSE